LNCDKDINTMFRSKDCVLGNHLKQAARLQLAFFTVYAAAWPSLRILNERCTLRKCFVQALTIVDHVSNAEIYGSLYRRLRYTVQALPSENCTTAHLPLHAHLRAPLSALPPGSALIRSSSPSGRPTTTSALQVRRARTRTPEPGPMGPIASVNGVVGAHAACRC
jgi:hypothetical protein